MSDERDSTAHAIFDYAVCAIVAGVGWLGTLGMYCVRVTLEESGRFVTIHSLMCKGCDR